MFAQKLENNNSLHFSHCHNMIMPYSYFSIFPQDIINIHIHLSGNWDINLKIIGWDICLISRISITQTQPQMCMWSINKLSRGRASMLRSWLKLYYQHLPLVIPPCLTTTWIFNAILYGTVTFVTKDKIQLISYLTVA